MCWSNRAPTCDRQMTKACFVLTNHHGTLEGCRRRSLQKKIWDDDVNKWRCLPNDDLLSASTTDMTGGEFLYCRRSFTPTARPVT
ncbi:hypothetical protein DPMN_130218 [Dreissena polymorpha]|uniref:Uncharacterized protein n=1 Tax=Dreissena polymorpha TaxID=45954 RepID=A0A9D4H4B2_DREPO|nr:hypothetical protein DPMN_130218 [Dreissena polymorpha]